jgi:hypothetical protein
MTSALPGYVLRKNIEDLDITIEPYETPPEVRERLRNLLKIAQENNEQSGLNLASIHGAWPHP